MLMELCLRTEGELIVNAYVVFGLLFPRSDGALVASDRAEI